MLDESGDCYDANGDHSDVHPAVTWQVAAEDSSCCLFQWSTYRQAEHDKLSLNPEPDHTDAPREPDPLGFPLSTKTP